MAKIYNELTLHEKINLHSQKGIFNDIRYNLFLIMKMKRVNSLFFNPEFRTPLKN